MKALLTIGPFRFYYPERLDAGTEDIVTPHFSIKGEDRGRLKSVGICFHDTIGGRRVASVYVQRCHSRIRFLVLLCHELAHAVIWLAHLPGALDGLLDHYYITRHLARLN